MSYDRTTIWLDKEKRDRVNKVAGIPFSEWVRAAMAQYLKEHEPEASPWAIKED